MLTNWGEGKKGTVAQYSYKSFSDREGERRGKRKRGETKTKKEREKHER